MDFVVKFSFRFGYDSVALSPYGILLCGERGAEFLDDSGLELRTCAGNFGELIHPFIGTTRVNDPSRLKAALARRNDRIDGIAPTAPHDVDIFYRISSRAEGPEKLVAIPDVDVIVDDDDIARQQRRRPALRGDHRGLLCMARVTLLDRNDD